MRSKSNSIQFKMNMNWIHFLSSKRAGPKHPGFMSQVVEFATSHTVAKCF